MPKSEEDREHTARTLIRHKLTGDDYIIEWCPVYDDGNLVKSKIIAADGPIQLFPLFPDQSTWRVIDRWTLGTNADLIEYLEKLSNAKMVDYPVKVRIKAKEVSA